MSRPRTPRTHLPLVRIAVHPSEDGSKAVILRRAPQEWVSMLLWDLEADTIQGGGWLRARVDPHRCGLSPDGRLFVMQSCAYQRMHGELPMITFVVRPPWFTALALWENHGGPEFGGGRFLSNQEIELHDPEYDELKGTAPEWFSWKRYEGPYEWGVKERVTFETEWQGRLTGRGPMRLRDGWIEECVESEWKRLHDLGVTEPDPRPSPEWARGWPDAP